MKSKSSIWFIPIFLSTICTSPAPSTVVTLAPGFNLIANPYDNPNGNNLVNLIPNAPENTDLYKYVKAGCQFVVFNWSADNPGWLPLTSTPLSMATINPGEGVIIFVDPTSSPTGFPIVFNGNAPTPAFPIITPGFNFVSSQNASSAGDTYNGIVGNPPNNPAVDGTYLFRVHSPGTGAVFPPGAPANWTVSQFHLPDWTVYQFHGNSSQWTENSGPISTVSGQPEVAIGEGVLIFYPSITCPGDITTCNDHGQCGAVVSFAPSPIGPAPVTTSCSPPSPSFFPVGSTTVTCTGIGPCSSGTTCSFTVTVKDCEVPSLHCQVAVQNLWSPLNQLIDVGLTITASDACSSPVTTHVSVYSDEGTSADATYVGSVLRLRAQRIPPGSGGDGRVYLIVVTVTDAAGNHSVCCQTVVVPANNSPAAINSVNAQAASALAVCGQSAFTPLVILP